MTGSAIDSGDQNYSKMNSLFAASLTVSAATILDVGSPALRQALELSPRQTLSRVYFDAN